MGNYLSKFNELFSKKKYNSFEYQGQNYRTENNDINSVKYYLQEQDERFGGKRKNKTNKRRKPSKNSRKRL
jgi:hypothetical protein